MNLKQVGSNMTELSLNDGTIVLFSYQTPVAAKFKDGQVYETNKYFSRTTTKHINKYLVGYTNVIKVDQVTLDDLVK